MNMINHELSNQRIIRDTTRSSRKLYNALFNPNGFTWLLCGLLILMLALPFLWPVWCCVIFILAIMRADYRFTMPIRLAKDTADDVPLSDTNAGILHLGNIHNPQHSEHHKELWLNAADSKAHMMLLGTTGSGKTETLIGLGYNALTWGSAFCYADGKADASLVFSLWSIARKLGREDDMLVLNYLIGDETIPPSNTFNPFAEGSASTLLQFLTTLMPRAGGDSATWQDSAIDLMSAILTLLCYKRDQGELNLSLSTISHYMALDNLVTLYIEGKKGHIPDRYFVPLRNYFETGLPGFKPSLADKPDEWDNTTRTQHGYLTRQFGRTLSMMADSYGHIFNCEYPDIDMNDVLINNRILVVLIPSLEKSKLETKALGKHFVASIKIMMARKLGVSFEGHADTVIDGKTKGQPYPYLIICDELSYYFNEDLRVMFAQARSLGFMMIAAMQDLQGFKGIDASDAGSLFANTAVKWCLKLEDPKETYEFVRDTAGMSNYSVVSGHDIKQGLIGMHYRHQDQASVQRRERVSFDTLKKLNPGEGIVMFEDKVLPAKSFYVDDASKRSTVLSARLNRMIEVRDPVMDNLPDDAVLIDKSGNDSVAVNFIQTQFTNRTSPSFPDLHDPILSEIHRSAVSLSNENTLCNEEEKGQVLFMSALMALEKQKKDFTTEPPWHYPDFDDE